jgi:hypothetical protein
LVCRLVDQRVLFNQIIDAIKADIIYQVLAEQTLLIMKKKRVSMNLK